MTKKEKQRKLDELYHTDLDAYHALLVEDWTEYDWKVFNKIMTEPMYDEWNDVWMPSYYDQYIKNT